MRNLKRKQKQMPCSRERNQGVGNGVGCITRFLLHFCLSSLPQAKLPHGFVQQQGYTQLTEEEITWAQFTDDSARYADTT